MTKRVRWDRLIHYEEQRLIVLFNFRLVGMTRHADIRLFTLKKGSSALRELPAFVQKMTDDNAVACQFNHGLWWSPLCSNPSTWS